MKNDHGNINVLDDLNVGPLKILFWYKYTF